MSPPDEDCLKLELPRLVQGIVATPGRWDNRVSQDKGKEGGIRSAIADSFGRADYPAAARRGHDDGDRRDSALLCDSRTDQSATGAWR